MLFPKPTIYLHPFRKSLSSPNLLQAIYYTFPSRARITHLSNLLIFLFAITHLDRATTRQTARKRPVQHERIMDPNGVIVLVIFVVLIVLAVTIWYSHKWINLFTRTLWKAQRAQAESV